MASRSISLTYTPYIHHLIENVSLLWSCFLFPLIMDCPAPSPKSFGGKPVDRILSSSKKILQQKNHPLEIEIFIFFAASVKAVFIAIVVFFIFRLYIGIHHASFDLLMVIETSLQYDKSNEWSNVLKFCFHYFLFSSLLPSFFISNFIHFFWPHS